MFDYSEKVVAVTGTSSNLGKQMAEGFAKCGANLVLLARRIERLEAAVSTVEKEFGKCEVIVNFAGGERGTGTPL